MDRHCQSAKTLERYIDAWKWLALWLQTQRYHTPNAITYRNALEYIDWRTSYKKKTGKGGEDRAFSVPMPTALKPRFEELLKTKKKFTLEFPFQPSRRWQQFFIKMKMTHLTFHCLRVTYVNRLRRAGVPREAAMRLVNHSSELVHQVYQREKVRT